MNENRDNFIIKQCFISPKTEIHIRSSELDIQLGHSNRRSVNIEVPVTNLFPKKYALSKLLKWTYTFLNYGNIYSANK